MKNGRVSHFLSDQHIIASKRGEGGSITKGSYMDKKGIWRLMYRTIQVWLMGLLHPTEQSEEEEKNNGGEEKMGSSPRDVDASCKRQKHGANLKRIETNSIY